MTHIDNLEKILSSGKLICKNHLKSPHVSIALDGIQTQRESRRVPCNPGGNLHDYVPFYFCPRSPMLYVLHKGYVESYEGKQDELLHLVTTVERIQDITLPFVISDVHPVKKYASFHDSQDGLNSIDWEVIASHDWNPTDDDPKRKDRKQAEFLAYRQVPWLAIEEIGVIDSKMKSRVDSIMQQFAHQLIRSSHIRKTWYY